ncbi:phage uncharacterized protein [Fibrella aestuarina BUZ 2]|uniref:Phage uncharacterized protein n=1 Tax=Fibrella aestuarina BUZ 2 TaxID=1166018 RepID=I0KCT8_9BACT|nr:terminase large subunit [Fibrella aestuarina]CCH01941.1 phage uncharacterized protein [Fibrella aestuarina BUZ 2]
MSNRGEHIAAAKAELERREARCELARRSFAEAVKLWKEGYSMQWFHELICAQLQAVQERKIQKLMIFVPPQHGKSELSTRKFPAWVLGKDPDQKMVLGTYSASLAAGFNRDIQKVMGTKAYQETFPGTVLPGRGEGVANTEQFEILGHEGGLVSVGRGGSLTGKPADLGIIDDPLKDRQEAQSPVIREALWSWYQDVFETRLHNGSAQVLIQTRWDEEDLGGRLLVRDGYYDALTNPTGWTVISLPGLRTEAPNPLDPRQVGEALWPERHSREKLEKVKKDNELTFNSLYQQDPRPSTEALVYPNWQPIDRIPPCEQVYYGKDFGYSNDPTTLVKIHQNGNKLYLEECYYKVGLTNRQIVQHMHAVGVGPYDPVYADSAEPKSIDDLKQGFWQEDGTFQAGFNVIPAEKGPDSLLAGINKLKEFEVYYHVNSHNLAREQKRYQWVMMNGKATNVPIDSNNHLLDGVRYAVFTRFRKPDRWFGAS